MNTLIGPLLASARRQRKITQRVMAQVLGVCQQTVSQWERGDRPVPETHLESACSLLGLTRGNVCPIENEKPRRAGARVRKKKRVRLRPSYPIATTPQHMSTLGPSYKGLHDRVKARLPDPQYEAVVSAFPHDTPYELAFIFHLLEQGARWIETTLSRLRFPSNVLHDETWEDGQDLVQPALVWERGEERLVVFGQVWLNLPWEAPVRPDFLVWYKQSGRPGYWLWVEIDDESHRDKRYRDQERPWPSTWRECDTRTTRWPARGSSSAFSATFERFVPWPRSVEESAGAAREPCERSAVAKQSSGGGGVEPRPPRRVHDHWPRGGQ